MGDIGDALMAERPHTYLSLPGGDKIARPSPLARRPLPCLHCFPSAFPAVQIGKVEFGLSEPRSSSRRHTPASSPLPSFPSRRGERGTPVPAIAACPWVPDGRRQRRPFARPSVRSLRARKVEDKDDDSVPDRAALVRGGGRQPHHRPRPAYRATSITAAVASLGPPWPMPASIEAAVPAVPAVPWPLPQAWQDPARPPRPRPSPRSAGRRPPVPPLARAPCAGTVGGRGRQEERRGERETDRWARPHLSG